MAVAKKKHAGAQRKNAGRPAKTYKPVKKHRNPGKVTDWMVSGLSVIGGAVGSKVGTQLVLGSKNTGVVGYIGNGVATGLLGWASHMLFRNKLIAQMVVAGGIAQIIVRVISDQTAFGGYLTGAGVGDYQVSHFLAPQRMPNALESAEVENPGGPWKQPAAVVVANSAAQGGMSGYQPDWN